MGDIPDNLPAVPPQEVGLDKFAPSLTVLGPDQQKFSVATTAAANRAFAQITVSRVRGLLHKKLDEIEKAGTAPDPLTLNRLASASAAIEDMAAQAYGKTKVNDDAMSDFAKLGIGLVYAAAAGATEGTAARSEDGGAFRRRLEKIRGLGRAHAAKHAEIVIEEPPPQ